MSRCDSGGSSMNTRLPVMRLWISDDDGLAKAFCSMLIIMSGIRNAVYGTLP